MLKICILAVLSRCQSLFLMSSWVRFVIESSVQPFGENESRSRFRSNTSCFRKAAHLPLSPAQGPLDTEPFNLSVSNVRFPNE